jgi:hypothetical protein
MTTKMPFSVSKAKLQPFFLTESGQVLSRQTFRKYINLAAFCESTLNMTPSEYKRRKNFFGSEVEAICKGYGIDVEDLV